ncbi:MAG: transglycosylase SLT domain-containing protein [Elusimicrobiota bacterium]
MSAFRNPRFLIPVLALAAAPAVYYVVSSVNRPVANDSARAFWGDQKPADAAPAATDAAPPEDAEGGPAGETPAPAAESPRPAAPAVPAAPAKPGKAAPPTAVETADDKPAAMPKVHLRGSRRFGMGKGIGRGFDRGLSGGRRGVAAPGAAGAPASAAASAAAAAPGGTAFDGQTPPPASCAPGTQRNIQGLCDLLGVKSLTSKAAETGGERSAAISDKGYSGSNLQPTVLDGNGAATLGTGNGGSGSFAQDPSQPIAGAAAPDVQIPAATQAAPWQKEVDAAQALMKRAGELIATSSLLVFFGKMLCNTITGAAAGAAMIAAGMAMAGVAAAWAGAATVLGGLILFKWGQKLQGAVITLSAAALTIAAIKAAQGDKQAYAVAEKTQASISQNATDLVLQHSSPFDLVTRDYLSAIRTGLNFVIGGTKAGTIMNGGFGLVDGITGLAGSGGGLAGFRAGLGLAQTVAGLVPIKGQAGQILDGALTATQIATDMWPTKSGPPPAAKPDGKPADPAAAGSQDPPPLDGKPAGNGMGTLAPDVTPQNADLLAAAREPAPLEGRPIVDGMGTLAPDVLPQNADLFTPPPAPRTRAEVEAALKPGVLDYAASINETNPDKINAMLANAVDSRLAYEQTHPGEAVAPPPDGSAKVTTQETFRAADAPPAPKLDPKNFESQVGVNPDGTLQTVPGSLPPAPEDSDVKPLPPLAEQTPAEKLEQQRIQDAIKVEAACRLDPSCARYPGKNMNSGNLTEPQMEQYLKTQLANDVQTKAYDPNATYDPKTRQPWYLDPAKATQVADIDAAAKAAKLDPGMFKTVLTIESGGNPLAASHLDTNGQSSYGIGQVTPIAYAEINRVNALNNQPALPYTFEQMKADPKLGLDASAKYFALKVANAGGNYADAGAAYNSGTTWDNTNVTPWYTTAKYHEIMQRAAENDGVATPHVTPAPLPPPPKKKK